mmetsp:Transcript_32922/g.70625  ORF Transcript_32922/g.70625 Transcript_32922/m.70625 type:complete len:826 (+) Transcript_32922:120-2597(+)
MSAEAADRTDLRAASELTPMNAPKGEKPGAGVGSSSVTPSQQRERVPGNSFGMAQSGEESPAQPLCSTGQANGQQTSESEAEEEARAPGSPQERQVGRCESGFWHLMAVLFPFLLLGPEDSWRRLRKAQRSHLLQRMFSCRHLWRCAHRQGRRCQGPCTYLLVLLGWIFATCVFLYIILATSAETNTYYPANSKLQAQYKLFPNIGNHLVFAVIIKQIIVIFLVRELCLCMTAQEDLCRARNENTDENVPEGVFMFFGWKRCHKDRRWFTSFLADHLLLVSVGVPFVSYKLLLIAVKYEASMSDIQQFHENPYFFACAVVQCVLTAYIGILVGGFLVRVLGNFVVPRKGEETRCKILFMCLLVLWGVEFLVISEERSSYLSSTFPIAGINRSPAFRAVAAFAQIFVTHSSAMLGAVLQGHSGHFKKCPDLQWGTFFFGIVPWLLICMVGHSFLVDWMTEGQLHPLCRTHRHQVAVVYPYLLAGVKILGGLLLVVSSMVHWRKAEIRQIRAQQTLEQEQEQEQDQAVQEPGTSSVSFLTQNTEVGQLDGLDSTQEAFSYDTVLILLTFSLGIMWNVVQIYVAKASKTYYTLCMEICALVAPVGVALFAMSYWKEPHVKNCVSRMLLWVALIVASISFGNFQYREDCEITNALPGCCNYPGLPDYNEAEERSEVCNMDERCEKAYYPNPLLEDLDDSDFKSKVYCLPKEFSNETDPEEALEGKHHEEHTTKALSDEECRELNDRWHNYRDDGWNAFEIDKEEEHFSIAYKVFNVVGQVGATEFYFTSIGVILKLIILVNHPRSKEILDSHNHHAHHGDGGHGHHAEP